MWQDQGLNPAKPQVSCHLPVLCHRDTDATQGDRSLFLFTAMTSSSSTGPGSEHELDKYLVSNAPDVEKTDTLKPIISQPLFIPDTSLGIRHVFLSTGTRCGFTIPLCLLSVPRVSHFSEECPYFSFPASCILRPCLPLLSSSTLTLSGP